MLENIREYSSNSSPVQANSRGQVLYLRVLAKAAYVSSSRARMENPEPVDVDISKSSSPSNKVTRPNDVKSLILICSTFFPSLY
jgi:hypothetical protein